MSRPSLPVAVNRPCLDARGRRGPLVRRTTVIDTSNPDGLTDDFTVGLRGDDVVVGDDGTRHSLASVTATVVLTRWAREVRSLETSVAGPALAHLVGASAASGFRRQVHAALDPDRPDEQLLLQLLDDLPAATLVGSGHVLAHAGIEAPGRPPGAPVDVCAGFAADSFAIDFIDRTSRTPAPTGPAAPQLPFDAATWPGIGPLPTDAVRRVRRLDVLWGDTGLVVDSYFRDSHADGEGNERIVHEYRVEARADTEGRIIELLVSPHVLPWPECPRAMDTADRLRGVALTDVRERVRSTFSGPTTCTHLNDMFRALADAPSLVSRSSAAV